MAHTQAPTTTKGLLVLALLVVATLTQARAQRIHAYVAAGAVTSQIEGDELKGFDKWGFTGGVGAIASLTKSERWWLAVEADYARHGSSNDSGNPYNVDITLDYVEIPLTCYFKDPYGGIMIGLGPVYGRLVNQPHGDLAYRDDYFVPDTSDMAFLKNDLSLAVELKFTAWRGLQVSIRYQRSLMAVKRDWQFTEHNRSRADDTWTNNCYNQSAQIRLIWQF